LEAAELVFLGESGGGGMVIEEVHLVVPEVGGGEKGSDRAGRAEGGVGAAVPVVLSVRSGRRGGLGGSAARGSPGWLHAGLDPGPHAVAVSAARDWRCRFVSWWKKSRTCTNFPVLLSISIFNRN